MTIWGSFLRGRRRETSNSPASEPVTSGLPPRELTPHPPSRQRYHSAPGTVQISPSFKAGITSSRPPATELSRTTPINDVPSIATHPLTHRICLVPQSSATSQTATPPFALVASQKSGHNGKIYIKDTKSSSGTFLNHVHISCPGFESAPYQLNDGDFVQLGVDYQGGMEDIYKSVRMQIEIGRDFAQSFSTGNIQPCNHVTNIELSSDHGGTNTHFQESRQEPGGCSSFIALPSAASDDFGMQWKPLILLSHFQITIE
ncbi:hypothetical protein BDR06DRAFT_974475 [Suillus hirtellus]|nr:hypothetical protein BDR06DRAFT_974475 [Suillus hirtellus]